IYEDSKENLWVATDGSINRYDYDREQFVTFRIIDENGQFNANWAYKILEDANHNLWIGSYLGGVHVIQNERILVPNKEIIADKAYNSTNGFPNNLINQIIIDANEDKWILFYKDGHLLKIENKTDKIQMYDLRQQLGMLPMFLITDTQDRLWCGFQGGVALLDKAGKVVKKLSFSEKGNENIKDIELVESNLWVATSQEVWLVNTDNATQRMLPLPNRIFTAIYHDHHEDKVILGSVDEIIRVTPSLAYETREARPLCITSISVNDNPYRSGTTPRLLDKLYLNHTQKRITIQFSDLNYALHSKPRYEYRLTGMQPQWSILPENQNLITISNLKPGKYTLQIRPVNIATELFSFDINMAQPWFNTGWAWTTYLILIVALILGVSHYSRVQKRLRKERAEKEEQLEAARETIRNMVSINTISTSKPLELLSVDEKMLAEVAQVVETNMANPDLNVNFTSSVKKQASPQSSSIVKSNNTLESHPWSSSGRSASGRQHSYWSKKNLPSRK
ncbi:MAG TPA: hypothetical protein DDX07_02780, partial [Porphyromonadaceae bacterium]|nr:hypothetical protein [Porphyromonadaceae bacterium]